MPSSTHTPLALVFPFEKMETRKLFQSHSQSVISLHRDDASKSGKWIQTNFSENAHTQVTEVMSRLNNHIK